MQKHLTDPGKKELRYSRRGVGQFYTIPDERIYELHTEPWSPLPIDNYAFETLKKRLIDTGLDHAISDNGTVKVILPYGQKFGYMLGWIAWTYHVLTEGEEGS